MDGATGKAYWRYWGKARKQGEAGEPYHLLAYHCLDVAAVGEAYLNHHEALRDQWARRLGIPGDTFTAWFVFFLSLHDLGKFSRRFQGIQPLICGLLGNTQTHGDYTRHDALGQLLYQRKIGPLLIEQGWLGTCADYETEKWQEILDDWAKTVTGHHGQPPNVGAISSLEDHFSALDQQAAMEFAMDCARLWLPANSGDLPGLESFAEALTTLSWWLAGLAVLCDWIGSSEASFPYRTEPMPLGEYRDACARPQAEKALAAANLLPRTCRMHTLPELFPKKLAPPAQATPLQQTAVELPLDAEPRLFILEDVTGAGKTEAALMLAHRLIALGLADGLYLGLPTMATSNAMYRRIRENKLPSKFFLEPSNLVLAHSASRLEPVFAALSGKIASSDIEYDRDEASASGERSAWFADSRKKALLADMGVGTVDQALLAVLYSRHQSLRLLGLARKVLIVDEVHACDAYMLKLLERLLTFHAAVRGSVILLSATLPQSTRQALASAYAKGLGAGRRTPALQETAYPLFTWIGARQHAEVPLATRPEVARTVGVESIHSLDAAVAVLLEARAENRCACWIRNTVDDAIAACESLREAGLPEQDLLLFHARFALADRMAIETRVLDSFGPDSGPERRAGKILVATQVVEQSLDLDFDLLLSDLAPVDLLIQRAGRLCRHRRDALGNRADAEERGVPTLFLLAPEFAESPPANWLAEPFTGTAAVYPDHGRLWLTAKLLRESGALVMPGGARCLIEGVYGQDSDAAIPAAFQAKANKIEGERSAKQGIACANAIKFGLPYQHSGFDPWDDTRIPTRLEDQPSVTVRLACLENGALRPWHQPLSPHAWELSQLSVRCSLLADERHDPALGAVVEACRAAMPDQGKWSKLLVLTWENGAWTDTAKNGKGEAARLRYDAESGLRKV